MPIAVVASFSGGAAAGSGGIAVSGFAAGDLIIVVTTIADTATNPTIQVPTDNGSNVYTQRVATTHNSTTQCVQSISDTVCVTPPTIITVNSASGDACSGSILRVTGYALGAGSYADQFAGGTSGGSSITSVPATTSVGGSRLVVQALANAFSASCRMAPQGYALLQRQEAGSNVRMWTAAKTALAGTTGAPQNWIMSVADEWAGVCGTYKQGAQASDVTRPSRGRGASW